MKTTIYFIAILLLASACKKITNSNDPVTIEGVLMASCDIPAANKSGFIITDDGLLSGPGISLSFTTDEKGYFKITYSGKESVDKFTIRVQGSSDVLRVTNLSGKTKNLGKVYINPPSVSYYLKLEVNNNSYTAADTLTYYDWGYPSNGSTHWVKKLAGPFENGIIDTVYSAFNVNAFPINYGSSIPPNLRIDYGVNLWNQNHVLIPTPHCVNDQQTIILEID